MSRYLWSDEEEERLRIAEAAALRELARIHRMLRGEEAMPVYRDLIIEREIDEGRPFPEELR